VTELTGPETQVSAGPSDNQLRNLSRMRTVLAGNWRAKMLAGSLWHFFRYQIYCTIKADDSKPNDNSKSNRYWIDGIDDPDTINEIRIGLSLWRNERLEEGLVHELLHVNLIPMGYPRFWIDEEWGSDKRFLAAGVINLADHEAMLPTYLSFGYSECRFLGKSRALTQQQETFRAGFSRMANDLQSPVGYLARISDCFRSARIKFRVLQLSDAIAKRNGWLV